MMSCNGKGHSSFARVKFQMPGGKAVACLPETLSFPGFESSGKLLLNPKKICCKSMPIVFCLMC